MTSLSGVGDKLAEDLAQQARRLGLHADTIAQADSATVFEFAEFVLQELAARGLVTGPQELSCWAERRSGLN